MTLEKDGNYAVYIVPNVVAMVVIYMMSPQIDWWWYQRRPPKLPGRLVEMFATRFPFFQKLSPPNKTKFCHRVALYMEATEFMPKGMEKVPLDVKAVVAATAVQLTFGHDDYLLNKFDHIIIYPHPFPSPQYKEWHACEYYEEDGVVMFSAEQLMAGFAQPKKFFHIGLYEYARVFMRSHPEVKMPELGDDMWQKLELISNFPKAAIEKWVGLNKLDVSAVAVVHFFVFPERFKMADVEMYQRLAAIFY